MVKIALWFVLLCVSLNLAYGQEYVSGVLTYQRSVIARTAGVVAADEAVVVTCAVGDNLKCKDCKNLMVCDGQGVELSSMVCEGSNPYCSGTSCTNVAPTDCVTTAPNFVCTSDGYKPDPTTCLKYYYCKGGSVDSAYDCPTGYYVDTTVFMCKRVVSSSNCATISCSGVTKPSMVLYSTNKSFYGFCATSTSTAIMFSCGTGYQFNLVTNACEYKCTAEGNFPGKTDTQYVFCYKSGGVYLYIEYDCPTGLKYDTTKRYCV